MKTCYITPVTNPHAFEVAREEMKRRRYKVVSAMDIEGWTPEDDQRIWMPDRVSMVLAADRVKLLVGWGKDREAQMERAVAYAYDIYVECGGWRMKAVNAIDKAIEETTGFSLTDYQGKRFAKMYGSGGKSLHDKTLYFARYMMLRHLCEEGGMVQWEAAEIVGLEQHTYASMKKDYAERAEAMFGAEMDAIEERIAELMNE